MSIRKKLGSGRKDGAWRSRVMEKVSENIEQNDIYGAVDNLRMILKQFPNDVESLDMLGALLLEGGFVEEAEGLLRRSIELAPGQGSSKYFYLGQVSSGDEAVDLYKAGIENIVKKGESPDDLEELTMAYLSLARIFLSDLFYGEDSASRGEEYLRSVLDEGFKYVEKALELDPANVEAVCVKVDYLITNMEADKAAETLQKHLPNWAPERIDDPQVLIHISKLLIELGHASEAVRYLRRVTDLDSKYLDAYFLLEVAYKSLGEVEKEQEARAKKEELIEELAKMGIDVYGDEGGE